MKQAMGVRNFSRAIVWHNMLIRATRFACPQTSATQTGEVKIMEEGVGERPGRRGWGEGRVVGGETGKAVGVGGGGG